MAQDVPLWTEAGLNGLSAAEVAERTARGEVNAVPRSHLAEYGDIVRRNLLTLLNFIIIPAAIALFLLDDPRGATAICGMAVVNTFLGLAQEIRAKWHLDHLAILAEAKARVLRDGKVMEIASSTVVKDDLLILSAGETVVADGTILVARSLEMDEALLTGESDPLPRQSGEAVLSGSFCVTGEGVYRAEKVGSNAYAQQLSNQARRYHHARSPLQEDIQQLIRILTVLTLLLSGMYLLLVPPTDIGQERILVQMIAATVTSMIPQGLILMATLAFVLGAVRMSKRGAIVQQLHAIETLAAIDVLCLDKTGTLTTNRLHLERIVPQAENVTDEDLRKRIQLFVSASLDQQNKNIAALRAAVGAVETTRLDQLPFKSQNRYSAVRLRQEDKEYVFFLGAVEALQPHLVEQPPSLESQWRDLTCEGCRVLLFTEAGDLAPWADGLSAFHLRALALLAFRDELRPEAGRVLADLAAQGIELKVISGDSPDTVRATVAQLNPQFAERPPVSGAQWAESMDKAALARDTHVFGRISPLQKEEIVEILQEQGRKVAMTGDGVNDVLPIKKAHLGIAMGEGARATKTVAGLVLENNDFGLLPQTLDEGRLILRNLRRAGKVFLVKNVYTLILIIVLVAICRLEFPYLPQQVTLLNIFTVGLPALLIITCRTPTVAMARPSWLWEVGSFAVRAGTVLGVTGLLLYLIAVEGMTTTETLRRTLLLTLLVILCQAVLLQAITDHEPRSVKPEGRFLGLTFFSLAGFVALFTVPLALDFFRLVPLTLPEIGLVLGLAFLGVLLLWGTAILNWRRRPNAPTS